MERIMVTGVSAGAGKSTFARRLAEKRGLPVYHLDTMYWNPGWQEEDSELFFQKQEQAASELKWVIEGNYGTSYHLRSERADTIIYLQVPLPVCLYRVIKRRIMYHNKSRPDMTAGCEERLDWTFFWWIIRTYHRRKREMKDRLAAFQRLGEEKRVFTLSTKKEIENFLRQL